MGTDGLAGAAFGSADLAPWYGSAAGVYMDGKIPRFAHLFFAAIGGGVVSLLLSTAVGAWVPAAVAAEGNDVRAAHFTVVDAAGKVRAVLDAEGLHLTAPDGALTMLDAGGLVFSARAGSTQGTSFGPKGLAISDAMGRTRATLFALLDGQPSLTLLDAAGNSRMSLFLVADGHPMLTFKDAAGTGRAALFLTPDGAPRLSLKDASGAIRTLLDAEH